MIVINFQKKDLWLLAAIIVFLVAVGYVIAIGSGNYQVQGHDFSELQKCGVNQILKINSNGDWECSSTSAGGCTPNIDLNDCIIHRWPENFKCESGYVVAGAQGRGSDSGEWNLFYCCKLVCS